MMRATAFLAVALLVFLGQPCGSLASRNLQAASAPAVAPLAPKTSCGCNTTYTPVCGADAQTYGNKCIADCARVPVASTGVCIVCPTDNTNTGCTCPFAPVCYKGITSNSVCEVECGTTCTTPGICNYNPTAVTLGAIGAAPAGGVAAAAGNTALPAAGAPKKDYADALHKVGLFYDIQRSGILTSQRLAWVGDSCFNCKGPSGEDLSGGFLEAGGSYLKLGMPSTFTVTMLAWTAVAFKSGLVASGELTRTLDLIKWGSDFLLNSMIGPEKFVAVIGDVVEDFDYYGPPEEHEKYVVGADGKLGSNRLLGFVTPTTPGAEIPAEAAAALAAASIAFKASDPAYSAKLLAAAQSLYAFAVKYPISYNGTTDPGLYIHDKLYPTTGCVDELAWAAAWLFYATGTPSYIVDARAYYASLVKPGNYPGYVFSLGEKYPALHVLLYQIDGQGANYATLANAFFDQYLSLSIKHTPLGFAYPFKWGGARGVVNTLHLAFVHSQTLLATAGDAAYAAKLFNYATYQMNYILGESGRSLVVGVGSNYPQYLWHKRSYNAYIDWPTRGNRTQWIGKDLGPWTVSRPVPPEGVFVQYAKLEMEGSALPQRFIAYGALYANVLEDDSFVGSRKDYSLTEPTTEGQGGLFGALAALSSYFAVTPASDCGLDLGWSHPGAVVTAKSVSNLVGCSAK